MWGETRRGEGWATLLIDTGEEPELHPIREIKRKRSFEELAKRSVRMRIYLFIFFVRP